jgi:hypothetical protein
MRRSFGELLDLGHAMNWWLGGARYDDVVGAWGIFEEFWKLEGHCRDQRLVLLPPRSPKSERTSASSQQRICSM